MVSPSEPQPSRDTKGLGTADRTVLPAPAACECGERSPRELCITTCVVLNMVRDVPCQAMLSQALSYYYATCVQTLLCLLKVLIAVYRGAIVVRDMPCCSNAGS